MDFTARTRAGRMRFLIQPRRSVALFIMFVLLHSAALLVLIVAPLLWQVRFFLMIVLFVSFIYTLRRHVFFFDQRSVIRCWCEADGTWKIQWRNGFVGSADLLRNSFISRYLMLLNFKINGRRFPISLPLAFDSASKETLRQLRSLSSEAV